jgi:hypothetical protein
VVLGKERAQMILWTFPTENNTESLKSHGSSNSRTNSSSCSDTRGASITLYTSSFCIVFVIRDSQIHPVDFLTRGVGVHTRLDLSPVC